MADFILSITPVTPSVTTDWAISLSDSKYNFKEGNSAEVNQAAFQAAINDAKVGARRLHLPYGSFICLGVTVDYPLQLIGRGSEDVYGITYNTRLDYPLNTGALITYTGPSGGFLVRGIGLRNTNTDVQLGCDGLRIDIRATHPTNNAAFPNGVGGSFKVENCSFSGFHINCNIINGFHYVYSGNLSSKSRFAGLSIASQELPDGGDGHAYGNLFNGGKYAGGYGIYWRSGGGFCITTTKFVNSGGELVFQDAIHIEADTVTYNPNVQNHSIIFSIGSGVSIETFSRHAVYAKGLPCVSILGIAEMCAYRPIPGFFYLEDCPSSTIGSNTIFINGSEGANQYIAKLVNSPKSTILPCPQQQFFANPFVLVSGAAGGGVEGTAADQVFIWRPVSAVAPPTAPVTQASPTASYATFAGAGSRFITPDVTGVKAVSFWLRSAPFTSNDDAFLLDARPGTGFYLYSEDPSNAGWSSAVYVAGQSTLNRVKFSSILTSNWVKVYIEMPATLSTGFTVLSGATLAGDGAWHGLTDSETGGDKLVDIADFVTYSRLWTDAEKTDAMNAAPTTGVIARYDFKNISGTTLPDVSGNNHPATLAGPSPVAHS